MRTNKHRTKSHVRLRVKRAVAVPSARQQRIAAHEAAHAVIARRMGLPRCGQATIVEPGAHAVFPNNHGPESIVALMAGAASEVVAFGHYDEVGVRTDLERWTPRLEFYGYEDSTALWHYTTGLVRENLALITFLAVHLEHYHTLSGEFIDRTVRDWGPPWPR